MRDRWRFLLLGGVLVACALWAQPSLGATASLTSSDGGWVVEAAFDRSPQPTWHGGFSPDEVAWVRVEQDVHRGGVTLAVGFFVEPDRPTVTVQLGVTPRCDTLAMTMTSVGDTYTEWSPEGTRYRVQAQSPGPGWYYEGHWWDGQAHDLPRWSKWESSGYHPIPGAPAQQSSMTLAGMRGGLAAEEMETDDLLTRAARWEHPTLGALPAPTCALVEFYPGEVHEITMGPVAQPTALRGRRNLVTLRVPDARRVQVRLGSSVLSGAGVVRVRTTSRVLVARWLIDGRWSGWRQVAVAQYARG